MRERFNNTFALARHMLSLAAARVGVRSVFSSNDFQDKLWKFRDLFSAIFFNTFAVCLQ